MSHFRSHCEICGKGPRVGNTVSHANNKRKTRNYPNVHRRRMFLPGGNSKRVHICTRCIRGNKLIA